MFVTRRRHEIVVDELNAQINRENRLRKSAEKLMSDSDRDLRVAQATLAGQLARSEVQRKQLVAIEAEVDHNAKATVVAKSKIRDILHLAEKPNEDPES